MPVAAHIESIDSMSAHADANEIMRWLGRLHAAAAADVPRPRRARADGHAQGADRTRAGWTVKTPDPERIDLDM